MSRESVLARGQAAAERGMTDTCTIKRVTGQSTASSGVVTPTYSTLYTGICRVQQHQAAGRQETVGAAYVLMLEVEVQLPNSVTGLAVSDEVTITAAINDADLVGRVFLIRDLAHASEKTARRVQCQERTS